MNYFKLQRYDETERETEIELLERERERGKELKEEGETQERQS